MLFVVGQRQVAEKRDGAREDREREGERERETASYLCRGKCSCMPERSIAGSSFRCRGERCWTVGGGLGDSS